jgi:hypothetical protein
MLNAGQKQQHVRPAQLIKKRKPEVAPDNNQGNPKSVKRLPPFDAATHSTTSNAMTPDKKIAELFLRLHYVTGQVDMVLANQEAIWDALEWLRTMSLKTYRVSEKACKNEFNMDVEK